MFSYNREALFSRRPCVRVVAAALLLAAIIVAATSVVVKRATARSMHVPFASGCASSGLSDPPTAGELSAQLTRCWPRTDGHPLGTAPSRTTPNAPGSPTSPGTPTTTTAPGVSPSSPLGFARTAQPSDRVRWLGSATFTTGVNVPWYTWPYAAGHGDFGGGSTDGVVADRALIASGFARVQATGTHMVRWWTFEGGAWQINRGPDGMPISLDPAIYADFDAAVALADQYDLFYDFVLFGAADDFPATWRTNDAQRAALGRVLAPLFARYRDNPRVMSWEIFNEPEWQIWNKPEVTEADTTAMASAIIASLRVAAPSTLVTVGSAVVGSYNGAQTTGINMWKHVDLDFYSPHWYDQQVNPTSVCALCTDAPSLQALYGTTKPIVIGEYEEGAGANQQIDLARIGQWYAKGFAGAWGWSLFPSQTGDGFTTDFGALTAFNASKSDIGPRTP